MVPQQENPTHERAYDDTSRIPARINKTTPLVGSLQMEDLVALPSRNDEKYTKTYFVHARTCVLGSKTCWSQTLYC
uniref:Uncharacterized protein n=1 Tax=Tetraselmis sp. GSL018 TaxID=582737 RepID=A0A061RPV5_9CHLO